MMSQLHEQLPIYVLLDTSASMTGEPLEALKQGFRAMVAELRSDRQTGEDALLSVIIYDTMAREALGLAPLSAVEMPKVYAGGVSALSGALRLLDRIMARNDGQKPSRWRPVAFLFTDGRWREDTEALRQGLTKADFDLIICACGAQVDNGQLEKLGAPIIMLNNLSVGSFRQYCIWNERIRRTPHD